MNNRRKPVIALGAGALAAPLGSFAQQPIKINWIAFLLAETISGQASLIDALRAGLRDSGYVEGKNIVIEIRSAEGNYDRLPKLAIQLVQLKLDVLVAFGAKAIVACRSTTTIPLVIPSIGDPVSGPRGQFRLAKRQHCRIGRSFPRTTVNFRPAYS